jgi:hypothetical protein
MKLPYELFKNAKYILSLPKLTINLMHWATEKNDPFYERVVREFYMASRKRHRKLPLVRALEYGVAVCVMPNLFEDYFKTIESSARRNYKKAERLGYEFRRIDCNQFLDDITAIRRSAEVRQGQMPDSFLNERAKPCTDPPSLNDVHDYPYFGVLKEGVLVAYAGCLVSGEAFMVQHIYGHAAHQADGVVPMLYIEMARYLLSNYPYVKYYIYGTYFGASETMRRFKMKFKFEPYKVNWTLGDEVTCHV